MFKAELQDGTMDGKLCYSDIEALND